MCLGFLLLNIFIYSFFAWYISNIIPGEYGTGKKVYFIFMPSYWKPKQNQNQPIEEEEENFLSEPDEDGNEAEIQLNSISKIYKKSIFSCNKNNSVNAVDKMSFSIQKGEVFALLGHNGAGKTTTIGILTGLFPPSSGDAFIRGFSVSNQMDEIRKFLGVCPQHDILFPLLTATEHLELYASLKGMNSSEITNSIEEILGEVGLELSEVCLFKGIAKAYN